MNSDARALSLLELLLYPVPLQPLLENHHAPKAPQTRGDSEAHPKRTIVGGMPTEQARGSNRMICEWVESLVFLLPN